MAPVPQLTQISIHSMQQTHRLCRTLRVRRAPQVGVDARLAQVLFLSLQECARGHWASVDVVASGNVSDCANA